MARGGFPGGGGGMPNMNNMMKQVQKMQRDMEKVQEEIGNAKFDVSSGGGAVTVTVSGNKEILGLNIKPEAVDVDDLEMLQDMIIAAMNEAIRKADEYSAGEMAKVTGGAKLPGGLF